MMMGSAETDIPKAPEQKTVFMEDLSDQQLDNLVEVCIPFANPVNVVIINVVLLKFTLLASNSVFWV
jgi:hypothetical protein